jgi:hypothetical protein
VHLRLLFSLVSLSLITGLALGLRQAAICYDTPNLIATFHASANANDLYLIDADSGHVCRVTLRTVWAAMRIICCTGRHAEIAQSTFQSGS